MRHLLFACSLVGGFAAGSTPSFALDSMDRAFGNTIVIGTAGAEQRIYYDPDGTYSNNAGEKGTWTLSGQTLCVTPADGRKNCFEIPAGKQVGDTWQERDAAGAITTTGIAKGRP